MSCKILAVGEVLWDLLPPPTGKQLGGAPANFAYHCRALGADAELITRVGDDDLGREVLERFQTLGLPTETVQIDPERPTGTVTVALDADGQPRYTIHEHVAWDEIAADAAGLARARAVDAIGFGSLAQRCAPSRQAIRTLVAATRPDALRVFDVNLRPPFVDRDVVAESLELANVLKLNDQELPELAAWFGLATDVRQAMSQLADRFALRVIALTRGAAGSLLLAHGQWSDHPGRPTVTVDAVGAGDAFTACLVVDLLAGRPLDAVNDRANTLAAYVCSQPGATPPHPRRLFAE